jgi:hypothetical protein
VAEPAKLIITSKAIILSVFMVCFFVGYGYSFKCRAKTIHLAFFNAFLRFDWGAFLFPYDRESGSGFNPPSPGLRRTLG